MFASLALVALAFTGAAAQYEQPTYNGVETWNTNIDNIHHYDENDFQTVAMVAPITFSYGVNYDDEDDEDFEIYGGKSSSYSAPAFNYAAGSSKSVGLSPIFETLPETFASPIYTAEVVNTEYVDQPIKAPKVIRQPIIQQRLVEQPVYRTRIVNQPVIRRIVNQQVIRPTVMKSTTTQPYTIEQRVVQPKIYEQNVIRQTYSEKRDSRQPIVEAPRYVQKQAQAAPIYSTKRQN